MVNPVVDARGNYKYSKWGVRSPSERGDLVFRAFPAVKEGVIQPQYIDTDVELEDPLGHVSDAVMLTEACVCWGGRHTFLSPRVSELREAGLSKSPARTLYWQLREMKEKQPTTTPLEVHQLFQYEPGRGSKIKPPDDIVLLQGALLMLNGKPPLADKGDDRPMSPMLLQLNQKTAIKSFLDEGLGKKLDESKPLSVENNRLGAVLSLDGKCLVVTCRKEMTKTGMQNAYSVDPGQALALQEADVKATFVPWDELLNFPSIDTSIQYMADAIGPVAVVLGLTGTPYHSHIPTLVLEQYEKITAPTQVSVPVAAPQVAVPTPSVKTVLEKATVTVPTPAPRVEPVVTEAPGKSPILDLSRTAQPVGELFSDTTAVPDQADMARKLAEAQARLKEVGGGKA